MKDQNLHSVSVDCPCGYTVLIGECVCHCGRRFSGGRVLPALVPERRLRHYQWPFTGEEVRLVELLVASSFEPIDDPVREAEKLLQMAAGLGLSINALLDGLLSVMGREVERRFHALLEADRLAAATTKAAERP